MEKEAQRFLEAEETAKKLVDTLSILHTEASSYQTATKELDTVRNYLADLIESTKDIVKRSHEVVNILKEIGGPEILGRLKRLEEESKESSSKQSGTLGKLKILMIATLASSIIAMILTIITLFR